MKLFQFNKTKEEDMETPEDGLTPMDHVESALITQAGSALTTVAQDHALLDKVSHPLKELVKIANFDVEPIWETAVDLAKKLDADTGAVHAAAHDTVDVFQRLGYTLKVFGHDVEGIWDSVTSAVKSHIG